MLNAIGKWGTAQVKSTSSPDTEKLRIWIVEENKQDNGYKIPEKGRWDILKNKYPVKATKRMLRSKGNSLRLFYIQTSRPYLLTVCTFRPKQPPSHVEDKSTEA